MTLPCLAFSSRASRLALPLIMLAFTALCYIGWQFDPHIADEDHLIEWTQAGLLALSCLIHAWRARSHARGSLEFMIHTGLSLLMYSFLMRELDMRQWDQPGAHFWTWSEHILRFAGWSCWLMFLFHLNPRIKLFFTNFRALLVLPITVLTICGGLFLVAGWPFDKEVFHQISAATDTFVEEVLELNGYILLLAAALADSSIGGARRAG